MNRALLIATAVPGCATSSGGSSSGSAPKSDMHAIEKPGCLWVGQAENTYNDVVDGVHNQTMTPTDAAAAMGKVQKKLTDVVYVAKVPAVTAHAKTGAIHAGRLRVALLGQGDADVSAEIAALQADMNAADAACSA